MIFRQLFDAESSTFSYILGCLKSRKALLIDPVKEQVDRDEQLIKELGLELVLVLNTHVHADHISGSGLLKSKLSSSTNSIQSGIARSSGALADIMLEDGQVIQVGELCLKCISTPGHTAGSYIASLTISF